MSDCEVELDCWKREARRLRLQVEKIKQVLGVENRVEEAENNSRQDN